MKDQIMTSLQRFGKALMGGVVVLPVAALLTGIGNAIVNNWGENWLATVFQNSGLAVLSNLGLIFAIAIAFGLAKDSNGAAALSSFVGFVTVTQLLGAESMAAMKGVDLETLEGQDAVDWAEQGWAAVGNGNVLIGILVGVLAAWTYNKYHRTELPEFLAFFSGRRLVPIMTSLFSIVLSGILYIVWPIIYSALVNFGSWIQGMGAVGAGLYGFFNRLLIPTGLHHALNAVFWFDIIGINDIGKFGSGQATIDAAAAADSASTCPGIWDGSNCEVVGIIGQYQAGFFPVMMFGLVGGALAIYLRADKKRRPAIAGLMGAGALASFFTGITEPLEFSFMFVAPLLYVVHAILTGLSVGFAAAMHWTAGFGFSAGLIDFVLATQNPLANNWWMLLIQGVVLFFIYFGLFYFLIGAFNLKSPGRGDEDLADDEAPAVTEDSSYTDVAKQILLGLGGANNIDNLDYCSTRLRVNTKDYVAVNEKEIKRAGVAGVVRPSQKNVQVIIGPKVQFVYDEMANLVARGNSDADVLGEQPTDGGAAHGNTAAAAATAGTGAGVATATKAKKKSHTPGAVVDVVAPMAGRIMPISEVPDPVFAGGTVGDGFAVEPAVGERGEVVVNAPVTGEITNVFKTKHAVSLLSDDGLEVLVHIGLDTVELKGEGFDAQVAKGDHVTAGQPMMRVDAASVRQAGKSLITPVVFTRKKQVANIEMTGAQDTVAKVTLS